MAKFTNSLVKSRPLKENGAEQVGRLISITGPCAYLISSRFAAPHRPSGAEDLPVEAARRYIGYGRVRHVLIGFLTIGADCDTSLWQVHAERYEEHAAAGGSVESYRYAAGPGGRIHS